MKEKNNSLNTTGFYRVSKYRDNNCKQGFRWKYQYDVDGKRKTISSVSIFELEQKVKNAGLVWEILNEKFSKDTMQKSHMSPTWSNITGFYRVCKSMDKNCKQGFRWKYQYPKDGKVKVISSVSIVKLEQRVRDAGLEWKILDEELAAQTVALSPN